MNAPPRDERARRTRRVYLALGSNLGDREAHLREAVRGLREGGVAVDVISSLYRTPPWGVTDQPAFLNAAVGGPSSLTARELLALAKRLEAASGRDFEAPRWTARPLDVDIALIEGERVDEPDLVVPHPLLTERSFVLVPLAEIAGGERHPVAGMRIATLRDLRPAAERAEVERALGPEWAASPLSLRLATEADVPSMLALLQRVFGDVDAATDALALTERTIGIVATAGPDGDADGARVVGAVLYVLSGSPLRRIGRPREAELRLLAVDEASRGRGVGERLVRVALERARADGARALAASAPTSMRAAQRLYERLDFRRAGDRDWTSSAGVAMRAYVRELDER